MTESESPTRRLFSLKSTILISFLVKFAFFAVGIVIIGLLNTRTQLPACGANSTLGMPSVYTSPLGDMEGYTDYRDLYLRCLVTPFVNGSSAYNLPIVYNYPPLFLYTLSAFALVNLIWFPGIPLVLFDALTVIPLYLICRDYVFKGNQKIAFAVSLIWIANPLNLFYNDLMWLNPGPTTFFMVLSIYLFLRQNYELSSLSLAVSTGFKQTSVLLFPLFIVFYLKLKGFTRRLAYYVLIYVGVLFGISLPYIYKNPQQYLWALQLPILGNPPGAGSSYPATFVYDLSQPVRLTTFLGLIKFIDLKALAVASYPILNYAFIAIYAGMMLNLILTKRKLTSNDLLIYCLASLLIFMSFFGRGVYKYYFAVLTPLAIPFFASRRNALIFEGFCIALLLLPRIVNPWMSVLLITILPSLVSKRSSPELPLEAQEKTEEMKPT